MKIKSILILLIIFLAPGCVNIFSQEDEEPVRYYQMDPLDDSLFIKIQLAYFIDPPDPKAEIVVDLRDQNNQTISIKGALYPFLALSPELRAQVINFPFKINLEETINYGSVFTRVISKLRFDKILNTPTIFQISPTLGYINPFLQLMGGERFGFAIRKDFGISFGLGTTYSGALETNYYEVNLHLLGVKGGVVSNDDTFIEHKSKNNHNNIYFDRSWQVTYTIPFGNFFEFGYFETVGKYSDTKIKKYRDDNIVFAEDSTVLYQPYLVSGTYYNWEFRYPFKVLESTRSRFYVAKFLDEIHIGYAGRELSIVGNVFDLRFDAMVSSKHRQPQYIIDVMIQKVFDYWAYSAIAIGPSVILGTTDEDKFGFTSAFFNI
ncbi:MAG TPA: hypothetical protein VI362_00745, partial [Ignavibacteriaceae bacterium]|nr:hypothetical protein [Ignavibacteriaceae bacterium]